MLYAISKGSTYLTWSSHNELCGVSLDDERWSADAPAPEFGFGRLIDPAPTIFLNLNQYRSASSTSRVEEEVRCGY